MNNMKRLLAEPSHLIIDILDIFTFAKTVLLILFQLIF